MNLKIEGYVNPVSVQTYLDNAIDSDYDGQLEQVTDKTHKAVRALGRLCEVLLRKDLLTLEELKEVSGDWRLIHGVIK